MGIIFKRYEMYHALHDAHLAAIMMMALLKEILIKKEKVKL